MQVDEVRAGLGRQGGERDAGGFDLGRRLRQPVEGQACRQEAQAGHGARRFRLVRLRLRAEHGERRLDPLLREAGGEVEGVGPDAADRVRRQQDAEAAAAAHRQHPASSSASAAGRSSWMSLKLWNCAR